MYTTFWNASSYDLVALAYINKRIYQITNLPTSQPIEANPTQFNPFHQSTNQTPTHLTD